jgi:hypothetical protein
MKRPVASPESSRSRRPGKDRGSGCNAFEPRTSRCSRHKIAGAGQDGDQTPDKGQIWDGGLQVLPVPLHPRRRGARLQGAPCLLPPARAKAAEARPNERWRARRVWRFPLLTHAHWRCTCPFLPLNHKPHTP